MTSCSVIIFQLPPDLEIGNREAAVDDNREGVDRRNNSTSSHRTEVDMITEGLNSALVFKNPRAVSYCGCGESFAVGTGPDGADSGETVDVGDLATDVGTH
jgi:hypothetical protein